MLILRYAAVIVALTFAELYVTVHAVPDAIGAEATIGLLVASSLLGVVLLKHQGRSVWRRVIAAVSEGRVPSRELVDGAIVVFGGALLVMPGFVTDALGLFMIMPVTRPLARRLAGRWLRRRQTRSGERDRMRGRRRPDTEDYDVEGTATEYSTVTAERVAGQPDRQLRR